MGFCLMRAEMSNWSCLSNSHLCQANSSTGESMRYSENLLVRFQQEYKRKFGKEIDLGQAEVELNRLARAIEGIIPANAIPTTKIAISGKK